MRSYYPFIPTKEGKKLLKTRVGYGIQPREGTLATQTRKSPMRIPLAAVSVPSLGKETPLQIKR